MRVNLDEVQEGCILSEDVFSKTNRPIIPSKTVITNLHIQVLKAFLIPEVEVEKMLVNGAPFKGFDLNLEEADENNITGNLGFAELFLRAVDQYTKEFHSWQSGLPIDITKIRALLLPLLEKMDEFPHEVFNLHRYSTKETYMDHHSVAIGLISGFIAKKMNLNKGDWIQAALAGCLADCGMAKINHNIFQKKIPLTSQEIHELKKHPIYSYKMVKNIHLLREDAKISILEHHEKLDGSGYPLKAKEEGIPQIAKIITIADAYHAMTSEKVYQGKESPYKALEMMREDFFGEFDITILKILTDSMIDYSTGDKIRLSDGRIAEILFVDDKSPTRPLVKIVDTNEMLQLSKYRNLFIESVLL